MTKKYLLLSVITFAVAGLSFGANAADTNKAVTPSDSIKINADGSFSTTSPSAPPASPPSTFVENTVKTDVKTETVKSDTRPLPPTIPAKLPTEQPLPPTNVTGVQGHNTAATNGTISGWSWRGLRIHNQNQNRSSLNE